MGAEGAVNIIFRDEIAAAADPGRGAGAARRRVRGAVRQPVHRGGARLRRRRHPAVRDAAAADRRPRDARRQARHATRRRSTATSRCDARLASVFARRRLCARTATAAVRPGPHRQPRRDRGADHPGLPRARASRRSPSTATPTPTPRTSGRPTSAVRLGPAPAAESYLRVDAIVEAAHRDRRRRDPPGLRLPVGAGGVRPRRRRRPGSSSSARRPTTIAALGDKLAARRTAAAAGVPVVPGTFEPAPVDRPDAGRRRSSPTPSAIGFPLLVKAAAGGGGRGHAPGRRRPSELPAALAAASRRGAAAFGDGAVYLEREVRPARHIEVQLLGDARRHDRRPRRARLLDPAAPPEARRGVAGARTDGDERARAARDGGPRRAGGRPRATPRRRSSCFDPDRRFWFLEVNTRLQVEHGVTELVDRPRHRRASSSGSPPAGRCPTRSLAAAAARRDAGAPRDRGPPLRRGPGPRLRAGARAGSGAGRCRPGPASGSTPASRRGSACRPTTTR